jgi:diguanylate cyclase (GGDEF)-like protein
MSEHPPPTGYPPRLRALIASAIALAIPVVVGAAVSTALHPLGVAEGLAVLLFLALALLAELKPVPLEEDDLSTVSLAFVFILASVILFGWQEAVLIAAISAFIAQIAERKPLERTAFNTSVYALSAFAAAIPVLFLGPALGSDPVTITLEALLGGAMFVAVNFAFISLAISFHQRVPVLALLKEEVRLVGPAFAIQAFLAALAAALWTTDPRLLVLMAGPLFTVTLYQRSSLASRRATRDAHTDSLTRIGNNRAYELGLSNAFEAAAEDGSRLSLCLVDVDDFKQINDTYGHPLGDQVLVEIARLLRTDNDCVGTFRFGGDEFAILLACGETRARSHVEELYRRISGAHFSHGAATTVSVGLATFPEQAVDVESLERAADSALYWAKLNGKNRFCAYTATVAEAHAPAELERRVERQARLRAAENLIRVVDAKDEYTGAHSERVALLVEAIARELALDEDHVEQLKLAGRLHDLGKIAIPDRVLQKPGALSPHEERQLAHHPQLGASLLDGMDIRPVDVWIKHHHEHWDGSGYPYGLAGEEIPFGSRLILVADAYDAITTDRSYREATSPEEAIVELRRNAGIQFDPSVVSALEAHLEQAGLVSPQELAEVVVLRQRVA